MVNIQQAMQMAQQFNQFRSQIKNSGKNPQALLDELMASGKYSSEQLEQAKQMAELFKSFIGGR